MIFYRVETYCIGFEPQPIEKVNLKNKRDVYLELNDAAFFEYSEGNTSIEYFTTKAKAVEHHKWLKQQAKED
ncbi:MAG: hypothetical protein Unbinned2851contig1000_39 [Prokaryotic dsDNA virus sp.]|nr:MAG: hypothetical protein Unbinned2851contig1000_39 [Prokaryotic dsDNA virus sp.]|tara:strand:- start:24304 stop:24519 length:216 start_codon:yes stop_codon:yes gene_type:complete